MKYKIEREYSYSHWCPCYKVVMSYETLWGSKVLFTVLVTGETTESLAIKKCNQFIADRLRTEEECLSNYKS